jgi:acetyltransferase-like isoleucine patch superfamily enzyme
MAVGKVRKIFALAISTLPADSLRRFAYSFLLGYKFGAGSRVGYGTVIAVDSFECGAGTTISRGNRFIGAYAVSIGKNTFIGQNNRFLGSDAAASEAEAHKGYKRSLILGDDSLVNYGHIFDVIGKIEIGNGSWVAGFNSQFLTHGIGVTDRDISVGERSFIGSAVLVSPGSSIGSDCIVAMGSVVTKKFLDPGLILGGVPASVIRTRNENDGYEFKKVW